MNFLKYEPELRHESAAKACFKCLCHIRARVTNGHTPVATKSITREDGSVSVYGWDQNSKYYNDIPHKTHQKYWGTFMTDSSNYLKVELCRYLLISGIYEYKSRPAQLICPNNTFIPFSRLYQNRSLYNVKKRKILPLLGLELRPFFVQPVVAISTELSRL
jgi:hypothetical protein